jgi:hypothetical protein
LAWRFLTFQKDSALACWYRTRTEGPSGARKTTMIVVLARKLLIALWRPVTTGVDTCMGPPCPPSKYESEGRTFEISRPAAFALEVATSARR